VLGVGRQQRIDAGGTASVLDQRGGGPVQPSLPARSPDVHGLSQMTVIRSERLFDAA
jgi:hypothetical protein